MGNATISWQAASGGICRGSSQSYPAPGQWVQGVSRDHSIYFLENRPELREKIVPGKIVLFEGLTCKKIQAVATDGSKLIVGTEDVWFGSRQGEDQSGLAGLYHLSSSAHGLRFAGLNVGLTERFFSAASINGRSACTETPSVPPEKPSM